MMRIDEIISTITEDSQENKDINTIADFVVNNLDTYMKYLKTVNNKSDMFTLHTMSIMLHIRMPLITSPSLKPLLNNKLIFWINPKMKNTAAAAFMYRTDEPYSEEQTLRIAINPKLCDDKIRFKPVLAHEIQHAADYVKSKKMGFMSGDVTADSLGYDNYMRHPREVNARFAEALFLMSKSQILTRNNLNRFVNFLFDKKCIITPDLWPKEQAAEAQKIIQRLKSRAYKFYDEVLEIKTKTPSAERAAKIKKLISKTVKSKQSVINEDSTDTHDINILASYAAQNIPKFIEQFPKYKQFDLIILSKILKDPIPEVKNPQIRKLLTTRIFIELTNKIDTASFVSIGHNDDDNEYIGYIKINPDDAIDLHDLSISLAHEMQHAVDFEYSKGRATKGIKSISSDKIGMINYLKHPMEVNARLAEIMFYLSELDIPRKALPKIIDQLFKNRLLVPEILGRDSNDPKAIKRINHLKGRVYKYYDEVLSLPKIDKTDPVAKKTWITKVKELIKKYING